MKYTKIIEKLKPSHFKPSDLEKLLLVIALGLIFYGGLVLWERYQATHKKSPTINQQAITNSANDPDETKPDCDNYKVAPDKPRKIIMPNINIDGCIMQVGIDQHGAIAVPNNIHLAGWYTNSPLPGSRGVSIIDGHASGKYNPGIFKKLEELNKGDRFRIEFGDKTTKTFEIVDIQKLSVEETTKNMYQQISSVESQLNLITCGGNYDSKKNQFEKRILVVSKLVES